MKKILLLVMLVNSFLLSVDDFKVKGIGEKDSLFPYIVAKRKNKIGIAQNINTYLHLEFLELLPDSYKKSPFEMRNVDGRMPTLSVYEYDMEQNSKFISIYISMEGCGAYCESFEAHKLFLAKTGQRVHPRDLFTTEGLKKFNKLNHEKIQNKIKKFLKSEVRDNEQIEMYKYCLDKDFIGKIHTHSDFSIHKNKFILYSERCSNHAMRALDDLGDFENSYSFKELEKYLTPLGKYLLDKKRTKLPVTNFQTGIYKGKIGGKYPIKLFISEIYDDGGISASYWYDKYRKVIELYGSYTNGKLKLHAQKHNDIEKKWIPYETIEGRLKNNSFKGTWKNLEINKEYTLNMELN